MTFLALFAILPLLYYRHCTTTIKFVSIGSEYYSTKGTDMFFRRQPNRQMTLQQIDFQDIQSIANNLPDCVFNAVNQRDFKAIKSIYNNISNHETLKLQKSIISTETVLNNVYLQAIISAYSLTEFTQLFSYLPIDVNKIVTHAVQINCGREQYHQDSLLHIAAEKHQKDIFNFLIDQGADIFALSHDNKTLKEIIQINIDRGKHWPEDIPDLKEMLTILEKKFAVGIRHTV